jgi:DNA repair protein RecO
MDVTYSTEAIIIKRTAWREVDSLVTVYTHESGKLELLARGTAKISSRLAGHLEPLNRVRLMVINGRSKSYVGAVETLDTFYNIKTDLAKLKWVGMWLANFNKRVQVNQSDNEVYKLLVMSLTNFNAKQSSILYYQALGSLYFLKLCAMQGEGLDWSNQQYRDLLEGLSMSELDSKLNLLNQGQVPSLTKTQAETVISLATLILAE